MATIRNEKTEAGREMWKKIDEAADRAPQWVRSHINTLVSGATTSNPQPNVHRGITTAKKSK